VSSKVNRLEVGNRVRLSGGYETYPKWLKGKRFYEGDCVAFIQGQNSELAAVVRLDEPFEVDGLTGDVAVLELRYVGATWSASGVVHIELCSFTPEDKPWEERSKGLWVESNANYQTL